MGQEMHITKWHRELDIFTQIKNCIILEGNIYDSFEYPEGELKGAWLTLNSYLEEFFRERGYTNILFYDPVEGFIANEETIKRFGEIVGMTPSDGRIEASFDDSDTGAATLIKQALIQNRENMVIVMDFASRTIVAPDHILPADLKGYTILQQAVLNAADVGDAAKRLGNMLVMITNKQNDLPSWFYLHVNRMKGIHIDYPTAQERRAFLEKGNMASFFAPEVYEEDWKVYEENKEEWEKLLDRFIARTEGFTFFELMQLRKLCIRRKIRISKLCSVVDLYTYGIKDNPWESEDLYRRLQDGESILKNRVKGQDQAVSQALDVLKRSVSGLSGVKNNASPKGVLFFAGPTGTGKTETAKTLAELIFGDEKSCIRFDMSEYMHDNSDQRLFGAPPGYVGYEAGGQLTNAVRNNPFSILLFDEIEKASPSIMDKFLQILEDGRMTDGQGNTAYFSDCIIIFTSNLGIYTKDEFGNRKENVTKDMVPEKVRKKVKDAISDYFKLELGRPEILNRIGENIVVFDFIGKDAAGEILHNRVKKIEETLRTENGITVDLSKVEDKLLNLAMKNLENGGRGINNIVEKALINPLARHIFDEHVVRGERKEVIDIVDENSRFDIVWRAQ
ncbi:MAG: ATP-dependent Clp protease ATP-binding subunit [Lachnospiraceae bacterium]|nr:ATP-dependent Clp protease ATP-binding subunit [Lachnospiraceae bacterium]